MSVGLCKPEKIRKRRGKWRCLLEVLTPALRDVMDLEDTCRRGYLVVYQLQKNYVAL